jgi:hypothetical protein
VIGFSGRDPRTARAPGAENASQEGASFFPLARCCIRCTPGTGGAGNNAACLGGGSRLWTWWRFRRRGHHAAVFRPTQAGARVFRVNGLGLAAVKLRPSRVEGALREPNRFRVPWHIGAVRQRGPKSCSSCCATGGETDGAWAFCCRAAGCFRAAIRSSRSRPASSTAPSMPLPRPRGSRSSVAAHAAAQLRHASAGTGHRHPRHPGAARSRDILPANT